ncbi:lipoprotein-releasing ABC transporter permease subunit LolC [Providencia huaxiensis]|uniref:Lipoprotein-releasing ABC transporter permease subunit LolC n=1 Tax=Providencia huaxiensis TaxID=2027290 RepID=A0ABU2IXB9_9GAMM|nr:MULTISPECIES: lipoprotein-releasing ABC transporter permease subunit LolC [Providencia]AXH61128.1 lipoprotein-releasing ABC transporter permease subunit LolC [Providencia huaxiensis]MBN6361382.1 lipoprotein-releasing ABC transporter permease subunit LolC [Providencia huaxiensis]MBZ3680387.1 lipoprotein-releasing ABC transporter permease subunit LolC [Providencia rettgeri]MCD2527267.1 lipoprotein-releasing ABC transporter permease subunit LolC [Providencia huaxiensis]MCG9537012.1 lipoprotein
MHQSVSLFIGLRYLRGRAADKFGRFVSSLSAIGITLGVTALITVTSVMNGFERSLQDSILAYMPQAILTSASGNIDPAKYPITDLQHLNGVSHVAPIVQSDVVLQSRTNVGVGVMGGIEPEEPSLLLDKLVVGQRSDLKEGSYNVFLGNKLAETLGVKRGDEVRLIIPGVSQLTPMGRIPSQRLFTVAGIFQTNGEADTSELVVAQQDAARMLRYPTGHITGWRLYLDEPLKVDVLSQQTLPDGLVWKDWRERKGEFFQAVRMEKNMMGLLLSLIIAVAAFNIITSLSLLVMEKQGEVAILKTLGLKRWRILMIFMIQGAGAGVIGSLIGTILGTILSSQLNIIMPLIGLLPKGVSLPIVLDYSGILIIALSAMLISLLATLYPSWRAAAVQPAEALRYE